MRRDLRAALEGFVATHRGLRMGKVFGSPAGFAGRRVFARFSDDGLQLRLPAHARELTEREPTAAARGPRGAKGSAHGPKGRPPRAAGWTTVTSGSPLAARLEILLEQAARHVALAGVLSAAAALGWP